METLPHFENLLHTFAMQYKIKVQRNIETVCLLSKKLWFSAVCGILRGSKWMCVFRSFEWNIWILKQWGETLLNNRLLLKGITFAKRYHFCENVWYFPAEAFLYKDNLTSKSYWCNIYTSAVGLRTKFFCCEILRM